MGICCTAPKVLPIPDNVPENLKKVLEMGFPGCPMFQRSGNTGSKPKNTQCEPGKRKFQSADKEVVSNVFNMFEEQYADELAGKRLEDPFNSGLGGPLSVAQFDARLQERLAEMELEKKMAEAKKLIEEKRQAEAKRLAEEKSIAEEKRLAEEKRQAKEKPLVEERSLLDEIRLAEESTRKQGGDGAQGGDWPASANEVVHTPECPRAEHCKQHCTCYKAPAGKADDLQPGGSLTLSWCFAIFRVQDFIEAFMFQLPSYG